MKYFFFVAILAGITSFTYCFGSLFGSAFAISILILFLLAVLLMFLIMKSKAFDGDKKLFIDKSLVRKRFSKAA